MKWLAVMSRQGEFGASELPGRARIWPPRNAASCLAIGRYGSSTVEKSACEFVDRYSLHGHSLALS
jgi:hypothetical protein